MLKYNKKLTTYLFAFMHDIKRLKHHIAKDQSIKIIIINTSRKRFIKLSTSIKDEDQPLLIIKPTSV